MTDEEQVYQDDMSQVPDSELIDNGWYHVRITDVKTKGDDGEQLMSKSGGAPIVQVTLKIQNEGPMLGRSFTDKPSLQSHALFKLKAYYSKCGYTPGPGGHNPHKLLDCECYVFVTQGEYEGRPTLNIPPWGIRSIQEGPGREKPGKQKKAS